MADLPTHYAIDFGTSNSLLAAANPERVFDPVPLDPEASDPTILRSILCFPDAGGVFVGGEALRQYVEHGAEGRLLRSIKHHLGSRSFRGTIIRGRLVSAEELVGALLRQMRLRADAHFGTEVRRALLGRPVHFDGEDDAFAEGRLRKAAEVAEFEEIHFLPEPVAAARAFGAAAQREELALIGDFGGGTSDFTVLRIGPRALERGDVLAVGGVAIAGDALDASLMRAQVGRHFGAEVQYRAPFGNNVLRMPQGIVQHLCSPAHLSILQRRDIASFLADVRRWSLSEEDRGRMDQLTVLVEDTQGFQLFEAIERAKRTLSARHASEIVFTYPGIEVREPVTRSGFEEASRREVDAILRCLDETVRAAGVEPGDIGVVCCTGGTAKVPRIAAEIRRRLRAARMEQFKGFHSVVEGLAREAREVARAAQAR
ncbi:Hsp70 family protein [Anaeromyxobacter sp. Fw109-5]|uniref:Hsp70 family protein n=1 Tax=Anaeromyxobacter sp. (strain Fw109-5) TaxID=404589 RepID=UPI0000ED7DFF|nr:Hsp70 family protein [Anaeromyxobacter sp. Fw109-5]ABS25772.1 molecular chaperone-like protein [Anaeromyxobacter sp. Fw109-5]